MSRAEIVNYNRDKLAFYLVGLIALVLSLRLLYLQVVSFSYYRQISDENRIRLVSVPAPRGLILDRNEKRLVTNRTSYALFLDPSGVQDIESAIKKISSILNLDENFLEEKKETGWVNKYTPIKLMKDLDFKTICILEEQNEELPGVRWQAEKVRSYPTPCWSGHLFGYVGEVSQKEMEASREKGVTLGCNIGKDGLEKEYDQVLRGEDGMNYQEVSANGRIIGQLRDKKSLPYTVGSDLVLTIDSDLQVEAESALSGFEAGVVVALDPQNGEVLTLVSKPGFDPNRFCSFLDQNTWQGLVNDPSHPLLDRAVQGAYPPGSTYKLLTAGAALESKIVTRNTIFSSCNGGFLFGNRIFKCWLPKGHGSLDLIQAIAQSCDVYFYQLSLRLGLDRWSKYATLCGLNQKYKIDLPDEIAGMIPTREYYERKFGQGEWIKNLVINLGIGQGEVLTTPLGVAVFYSALVNGGTIYQPHLLKEIRSVEGRTTPKGKEILSHLPFSSSTLQVLKEGLVEAVESPYGTGALARITGILVGGKTGTAQNPHGREHAWFVGFAPANQPRIVVAVLIEQAGHGGTYAAPIAKRIMEKYLKGESTGTKPDQAGGFQSD